MRLEDIGLCLSPITAPYAAAMRELEIAELRRKNEEEIASALGVPAELLFNPLVQSVLADPVAAARRLTDERMPEPTPVERGVLDRYQDRRHSRRMKRR